MSLKFILENKKGTYKEFIDDSDDGTYKYPLKGVTFPTDYGYIDEHTGEDGDGLDVFLGSGDLYGSFTVWRYDVPLETKFVMNVTAKEWQDILGEYKPVLKGEKIFEDRDEFEKALEAFKNKT